MQLDEEDHTELMSPTPGHREQRLFYAGTDTASSGATLIWAESKDEVSNIVYPGVPKAILEQLFDAFSILSHRRNDHMLLQSQTANEVSTYQHKRRFAEDSILDLIKDLSSRKWDGQTTMTEQSFDHIKTQLLDDGVALESQSQIVIDVGSRCSSIQYRLHEAEQRFMGVLKDLVFHLPGGAELWVEMEAAAKERMEEVSEASEEIPKPAQAYFEAAGDIHVLREQIFDLLQQHFEDRAKRDLLRDQEKEPVPPDQEFEETYQAAQDALRGQLSEAFQVAEDAKRICEAQSIDIEVLRHRNRSDVDDFEEPPTPKALPFFMKTLVPELPPNGTPPPEMETEVAQQDSEMSSWVVEDWLRDPETELRSENIHIKSSRPEVKAITRLEKTRKDTGYPLRRTQSESMLYFDG